MIRDPKTLATLLTEKMLELRTVRLSLRNREESLRLEREKEDRLLLDMNSINREWGEQYQAAIVVGLEPLAPPPPSGPQQALGPIPA